MVVTSLLVTMSFSICFMFGNSSVWSADSNSLTLIPKGVCMKRDVVPSGYKHLNIQNQLEDFRKIYDAAYESDKDAKGLKNKPIRGLVNIISNTYALVHDYIAADTFHTLEQKEKYFATLKESWARCYDMQEKLTSSVFQGFYKNLASIIDGYRKQRPILLMQLMEDNPLAYPDWMQHVLEKIKKTKEKAEDILVSEHKNKKYIDAIEEYIDILEKMHKYINENKDKSGFRDFGISNVAEIFQKTIEEWDMENGRIPDVFFELEELEQDPEVSDPNIAEVVFIPCGNPKPGTARNISPIHFVRQFCEGQYPAYIAFFDILSEEKVGDSTTKEPRTRKDPHWSMENGVLRMLNHDLAHIRVQRPLVKHKETRDYMQRIYKMQENLRKENNVNDATILTNGLFMMIHERPDVVGSAFPIPEKNKDNGLHFFEAISKVFSNKITRYKVNGGSLNPYGTKTYKEENRDWEFLLRDKYQTPEGEIKPVHDDIGPFLPIEYDPEAKKMTRPLKDDPTRTKKMSRLIREGYKRFWNYFISIIAKNL